MYILSADGLAFISVFPKKRLQNKELLVSKLNNKENNKHAILYVQVKMMRSGGP